MADNDFATEAVGAVYAQALINAAQQRGALAEITEDVHGLKMVLETQPRFAEFCAAPTISDDDKIAALTKIFTGKAHPLLLETLKSMARRERLIYLPGFLAAFDDILARLSGRMEVELVTAQELSPAGQERIRAAVAKALGKEPHFTVKVDPTLLGGLRLRIEDTQIDGSVETQLQRLRVQLKSAAVTRLQQNPNAVFSP